MALKLAEEQAQREEDERKEDEATNPMKVSEYVEASLNVELKQWIWLHVFTLCSAASMFAYAPSACSVPNFLTAVTWLLQSG
jgi:hypothetical protein